MKVQENVTLGGWDKTMQGMTISSPRAALYTVVEVEEQMGESVMKEETGVEKKGKDKCTTEKSEYVWNMSVWKK